MSEQKQSITLYSQQGGSDKVYQLQINEIAGGFGLTYANGRRGSALKMKAKTTTPLTREEAQKEFDKIVKSKIKSSSRYVESVDAGDTLELSANANKDSGIRPKLMNEISEQEANKLCLDPRWVMQPKWDGERRPILVNSGSVEGTNRYGEITAGLKSSIKSAINSKVDMIFDSEELGGFLAVFDLLKYDGADLRNMPFMQRYLKLTQVLETNDSVRLSPIAVSSNEKQAMLQDAIDGKKEGVVFIQADSIYSPGKASSGGNILKYKLYDEASVIVVKQNTQRSVLMAVLDSENNQITVGNVTIPANAAIPEVGSVIEVRYLYAYRNGGSLYQPIFEKPRPDQRITECKHSQLKYKPEPLN
jgi:bifunctional non-homologous end joining protein LigD